MPTPFRRQVYLGLGPVLAALYCCAALLMPTVTTGGSAYSVVRQMGGDDGNAVLFAVLAGLQAYVCFCRRPRLALLVMPVALAMWAGLAAAVVVGRPAALLPGVCIAPIWLDVYLLRYTTIAEMERRRSLGAA